MYYTLRLLFLLFVFLLLSGCATFESSVTGLFEKINATDPLPENYAEEASRGFESPPATRQNTYSGGNFNGNSNSNRSSESSFEDWHNNQY